jgi:D-glycero-alpha-D-manno-heptose-7-phosphate kinase
VPPDRQPLVKERLHGLIHVPIKFEFTGSQVIFYDREEDYSAQDEERVLQPARQFRELSSLPVS